MGIVEHGEYYWVRPFMCSEPELCKLNTMFGRGNYFFEPMESIGEQIEYNKAYEFEHIKRMGSDGE